MCGIIGFVTEETGHEGVATRRKFMHHGLIIDTLRGDDSTGVFYRPKGETGSGKVLPTAGWCKAVDDGYRFVKSKAYKACAGDVDKYWFMFGHNRAATVGAVTVDGAHPFQEGPITLIHNGTLHSTYDLPQSQHKLGVDVDSHALCHNLALVEPEEAAEKVIGKIDGAFALVWHDARNDTLNIIRNDERPLHVAKEYKGRTLYFTSEAAQLHYLEDKLNLAFESVTYPEPGVLLQFKQGSIKPRVSKVELYNPRRRYSSSWWERKNEEYYGYGYTSAPAGGASGKTEPVSRTRDDRVLLAGKLTQVPDYLQGVLFAEGLLPSDRLMLTPMGRRLVKGKTVVVSGYLDSVMLPALVYNVQEDAAKRNWDQRWYVQPIGVKYLDKDQTEALVICRLQHMFGENTKEEWAMRKLVDSGRNSTSASETHVTVHTSEQSSEGTSTAALPVPMNQVQVPQYIDPDVVLPGPHGEVMTVSELGGLLEGGCAGCGSDISPWDAAAITWADDGINEPEPYCPECSAEDLEEGYGT